MTLPPQQVRSSLYKITEKPSNSLRLFYLFRLVHEENPIRRGVVNFRILSVFSIRRHTSTAVSFPHSTCRN